LGGATRGVVVGCAVSVAIVPFVDLPLVSLGQVLCFGFLGSLMLSLLGVIGGVWSEKFDQIAAVTNFVITPASFLSGTFYSVEALPERWRFVAHLDPFFYMIDGFRSGFIGHADANPLLGIAVLVGLDAALLALAYAMFARGYKLKA
jgi:ABC-2 type transport system permease protein